MQKIQMGDKKIWEAKQSKPYLADPATSESRKSDKLKRKLAVYFAEIKKDTDNYTKRPSLGSHYHSQLIGEIVAPLLLNIGQHEAVRLSLKMKARTSESPPLANHPVCKPKLRILSVRPVFTILSYQVNDKAPTISTFQTPFGYGGPAQYYKNILDQKELQAKNRESFSIYTSLKARLELIISNP